MIEMNGAATGLLVTEGHRDEIEMRRGPQGDDLGPVVSRARRRSPGAGPASRSPSAWTTTATCCSRSTRTRCARGVQRLQQARRAVDRGHVPVLVREPRARAARARDRPRGVPRRRPRLALARGDGPRPGVRAGLDHARERLRRAEDRALRRPARGAAPRAGLRGPAADHAVDRRRDAARLRRAARGHAARERARPAA